MQKSNELLSQVKTQVAAIESLKYQLRKTQSQRDKAISRIRIKVDKTKAQKTHKDDEKKKKLQQEYLRKIKDLEKQISKQKNDKKIFKLQNDIQKLRLKESNLKKKIDEQK